MASEMVGDVSASLAELEARLGGLYAQIAQQHGLPVAMQALGRLMLSAPMAPPPAPQPSPSPFSGAAAVAPAASPSPSPSPSPTTSPLLPLSPDASPPTATSATTAATTAAGPATAPTTIPTDLPTTSRPIAIPPSGVLTHARTLESIRTLPSASLSQMPSGVDSLISPSAADGGSVADGGSELDLMASGAADGGAGGSGGGAVTDAPRAAAQALAVVVAAKAAADVREVAEAADSPKSNGSGTTKGGTPRSSSLWQRAINLTKTVADPWASRNLHALHMERAVRQRYNAHTGQWVTDEVLIKVESKPFAAGAMRECFAAKKLSTFTHNVDWHKAQNMVAKRYKKEGVRKSVYYNDVLVQMDAKMLGEMYNRTDPPKQVDVMQCAILQLPSRTGSPVYAVEQLIEGDYVKYNSNSGFVKGDDLLRNTPQAFSHFTWALTKGLKICVDIQGVGDLYTDPQLHTLDGEGYGEGNLGVRGMGLFFRSHECNALCCRLGLKPFERCDADVRSQGYSSDASSASASATRPSSNRAEATAARTMARTTSYKARMAERRRRSAQAPSPATSCAEEALLAALKDVPKENPEALVHLEIAKLYGEVVLLPELRPSEDPEDALRGGLFHVNTAAQCGSLLALMVLAREHCGVDASTPQFAHLFKVGGRQRQFRQYASVAWRCTLLAAERGVRGAALAAATAYATGTGLFGEEVLNGDADVAQAARWYSVAMALPDLLAEAEGGADAEVSGTVIHEYEEEGEDEREEHTSASGPESDDDPLFEMSVMRKGGHHKAHHGGGEEDDCQEGPHASGLSELDLISMASLSGLRVPKLEELKPSRDFLARLKRIVEEEASALPGASVAKYEILYQYGNALLTGGPGLQPAPGRAAELLDQAAEEAGAAGKGKLAQKYYEAAAKAQAMVDDDE